MAELYRPLDYLALSLENVYAFADADDMQRSTAVMLAFYCAQVLNHGVIVGAGQWTEWQWVTRVRVRTAPGADAPGLWSWQGDDLHVLCYSSDYETEALQKRRKGSAAANARWSNKADNADAHADAYADLMQGKGREGKDIKGINKVCASSTGDVGEPVMPAPTFSDEEYSRWLAAMCQAHPSARRSRVLGKDVQKAAMAAYARCPQAVESAELLTAYLNDRMPEDCRRNRFYRPNGQRKFFEDLEDVLTHAERWGREVSWGKSKRRKADEQRSGVVKTPGCEVKRCAGVMTDAERNAFFDSLRGDLQDGNQV